MRLAYALAMLSLTSFTVYCQAPKPSKLEFEVASMKAAPPAGFFHSPDSGTGGPGTANPAVFHCESCTLPSLILKAFSLQRYQLVGQQSLPGDAYAISAKIPEGATPEQFFVMLQSFPKDRFGLACHFDQKEMQGYQLIVAKNGPLMNPSKESPMAPEAEASAAYAHGEGQHSGGGHGAGGWNGATDRKGLTFFNGSARYRGDHQTTQELAQILADQVMKPVEDRTGLTGKYDISVSWAGESPYSANRPPSFAGGAGHDHGGGGGGDNPATGLDGTTGPGLFDALQTQLGLKLVAAAKSKARILVIDHFAKAPASN